MDWLFLCNGTRASVRFFTCRISDCHSRTIADRIGLDTANGYPPDTPGIFHDNRHSAFLHLYRWPGTVWILGIPLGCHSAVLPLLLAQRCFGQCQHLGRDGRTGRNGCLCGFTLPDILPGTDLSKTTDKNTFSPVECIRSIATCHRPPVHPDTGRFHGVDHEPEQSLLQQ